MNVSCGKVVAAIIAQAHDGNKIYASAVLNQTAKTAIRLPTNVCVTARDVVHVEEAALCLRNPKFNRLEVSTSRELNCLGDCRPYAKFLHTSLQKSAATSTNAGSEESLCVQINISFFCQYYFFENHLGSVQHATVLLMFKHALLGLSEEKKYSVT